LIPPSSSIGSRFGQFNGSRFRRGRPLESSGQRPGFLQRWRVVCPPAAWRRHGCAAAS